MSAVLLPMVLGACCLLVSFSLVRLIGWAANYRDASRYRAFREQQLIAWAQMEAAVIQCERSLFEARRHG